MFSLVLQEILQLVAQRSLNIIISACLLPCGIKLVQEELPIKKSVSIVEDTGVLGDEVDEAVQGCICHCFGL